MDLHSFDGAVGGTLAGYCLAHVQLLKHCPFYDGGPHDREIPEGKTT
jgi:hypothetical protein